MDTFGISFTAAKYQVWNGLERTVPFHEINPGPFQKPDDRWQAIEEYTAGFHPVRGLRDSRAGRFSAVVVRAAEDALISWDSAAAMLETDPQALQQSLSAMKSLFPNLFS
ncbi:MAG: hypothetical protein KAI47_12540 [Deltaproteobacteria bacterium]|nr:hypothetical protein [Deltaproteobacteria bacterium]